MERQPRVLLTNDDGIDAAGIREIAGALSSTASVTVVAPAENQSGVSRANSAAFEVSDRDGGYAVDGTPTDCVHYGIEWLDTEFDVVVSGCNDGPNLGAHRLSQSGTVAAAIEAGFLGVPGVALSLFDPPEGVRKFHAEDYDLAGRVARFFVEELAGSEPEFDYLNVNVPADPPEPVMRVTEPVEECRLTVRRREDGSYHVWDHFWDPLRPDVDRPVTDPVGTDRRAVADEEISVTPLQSGQRTVAHDAVAALCERFD